jgi:peptidoglycan hydrolase CwlO-like protein
MQASPEQPSAEYRRSTSRKGTSVKAFLLLWFIFIILGALATYLYSNHLKQEMLNEMQTHTDQQIQALKADYEKQLAVLSKEVSGLQGKVQSFNELLTFTKDNANSKTDNSNKLYTQLNEVKQQLSTLQKKMGLLK